MSVYELRRYTLHPGRRDELIELFDREFVESQDAVDATVVGQYRDLDDPDQFVWIREFADMATRLAALTAFYSGDVWREHAEAANVTMVDFDNILLLRPVLAPQPVPGSRDAAKRATLAAIVFSYDRPLSDADTAWLAGPCCHTLRTAGATPVALFATCYEPNDFPRLPVREGHHLVALVREPTTDLCTLEWPAPAEVLRLAPTARSYELAVPT